MANHKDNYDERIRAGIASTPGVAEHIRRERERKESELKGINIARKAVKITKPTKSKTTNLPGYFYRTKTNQKNIERGLLGFYGNS